MQACMLQSSCIRVLNQFRKFSVNYVFDVPSEGKKHDSDKAFLQVYTRLAFLLRFNRSDCLLLVLFRLLGSTTKKPHEKSFKRLCCDGPRFLLLPSLLYPSAFCVSRICEASSTMLRLAAWTFVRGDCHELS